jgi:hypothetical protein
MRDLKVDIPINWRLIVLKLYSLVGTFLNWFPLGSYTRFAFSIANAGIIIVATNHYATSTTFFMVIAIIVAAFFVSILFDMVIWVDVWLSGSFLAKVPVPKVPYMLSWLCIYVVMM